MARLPFRIPYGDWRRWRATNPFAPGARGALRLTTAQRDELYPDPPENFRIFNLNEKRFEVYREGAWIVEATGESAGGLNDYLYTFGGTDSPDFARPYQYDSDLNSWAAQTDATDNMIDSAGGTSSTGVAYIPTNTSPYETQEFVGDTATWTQKGNHPVSPTDKAAASHGDSDVISFFGYFTAPRDRHDLYDIAGNSYSVGTTFPTSIRFAGAERIDDDQCVIAGGTDSNFSTWSSTANARTYNFGDTTFTTRTSKTTATAESAHLRLGDDAHFIGGQSNSAAAVEYAVNESYDVSGNAWTTRTAYPVGATTALGGAAQTRNATGYIAGGQNRKSARSYTVDSYATITDHGTTNATQIRAICDSTLPVAVA